MAVQLGERRGIKRGMKGAVKDATLVRGGIPSQLQ